MVFPFFLLSFVIGLKLCKGGEFTIGNVDSQSLHLGAVRELFVLCQDNLNRHKQLETYLLHINIFFLPSCSLLLQTRKLMQISLVLFLCFLLVYSISPNQYMYVLSSFLFFVVISVIRFGLQDKQVSFNSLFSTTFLLVEPSSTYIFFKIIGLLSRLSLDFCLFVFAIFFHLLTLSYLAVAVSPSTTLPFLLFLFLFMN